MTEQDLSFRIGVMEKQKVEAIKLRSKALALENVEALRHANEAVRHADDSLGFLHSGDLRAADLALKAHERALEAAVSAF